MVECMQRMEEMGKLRQSEMAEARKTVETFYATLGEAQKIVLMRSSRRWGPGMAWVSAACVTVVVPAAAVVLECDPAAAKRSMH